MEPTTIPRVIDTPTKVPTVSLLSSGALDGDLMAQRVEQKPLVKAKRDIFKSLNQSPYSPVNQLGPTLKAIKNDVTIKIALPYVKI